MTVYVSDPIYAEAGLDEREARRDIRNKVYAFMSEMAKKSTYRVYEYKRRENEGSAALPESLIKNEGSTEPCAPSAK